jgi:hypothetical protein
MSNTYTCRALSAGSFGIKCQKGCKDEMKRISSSFYSAQNSSANMGLFWCLLKVSIFFLPRVRWPLVFVAPKELATFLVDCTLDKKTLGMVRPKQSKSSACQKCGYKPNNCLILYIYGAPPYL